MRARTGFYLIWIIGTIFLGMVSCSEGDEFFPYETDGDWDIDSGSDQPAPDIDGDGEVADEAEENGNRLLFRYDSVEPYVSNISLTLFFNGNYTMRYNINGTDTLDRQAVDHLSSEKVEELKGYLNSRLYDLTQKNFMETGIDCVRGNLHYEGPRNFDLQWHCSEDQEILNFVSYMRFWIEFNILGNVEDGDVDSPTDGDVTDGDEDMDQWKGECVGPGEYEIQPLIDYQYSHALEYDADLLVFEDGIFRLQYNPVNGDPTIIDGELEMAQVSSLEIYIKARQNRLACFEGEWCTDGPTGHLYYFNLSEEEENYSLFVDYRCPDNPWLLEILTQINTLIESLLVAPDGDIDNEAFEDDETQEEDTDPEIEETGPDPCDDGNSCTIDSWDNDEETCRYQSLPDGARCSDGKPGTRDSCLAGQCNGVNDNCPDWPVNEQGFCETNIMGNGKDAHPMVFIPSNAFRQGFEPNECDDSSCLAARPAHTTTLLQGYWIDKYEVTASNYYRFAQENPSWQSAGQNNCGSAYGSFNGAPANPNYPVASVCWYAGQAFCRWAGKRMVSESEWEFAARGPNSNPDGRHYPWGNSEPNCGLVNFGDANGDGVASDPCFAHPIDIGSYSGAGATEDGASYFGIHDMSGNAEEWVFDAYFPYTAADITNPLVVVGGTGIVRGGSFRDSAIHIYSAIRESRAKIDAENDIGFRCATPQFDPDRDGISNFGSSYCTPGSVFYCQDNCPNDANPGQENLDGVFPGDACPDEGQSDGDTCTGDSVSFEAEEIASEDLSLPERGMAQANSDIASGSQILRLSADTIGDQIVFTVDLDKRFEGSLQLTFITSSQSGSVRLFIDNPLYRAQEEADAGRDALSLYAFGEQQMRSFTFEGIALEKGTHRLVVKVVGRSLVSNGYNVSIDRIVFQPETPCN